MDTVYNPHEIEPSAQQYWLDKSCFKVSEDLGKPKFYCLSMFPYPSGNLHMGHVRNYTIGDVISRYQRMNGKNVLQPIGWDAFGLPAENAAIKHKIPPAKWTRENIAYMRQQLKQLGFAYDWTREIATCDPDYYRWEQWFFVQLFKKKLVYRKNAVVNWDPVDQTVLANEQVVDGKGWRSGALVEKREIPQWFLKITHYADQLLDDIDKLEGWPEQVCTMQRNWIGRSRGVEIQFRIPELEKEVKIFTTRADTFYGCTYLAVAPDHPLAKHYAESDPAVAAFIETCRQGGASESELATQEKLGHKLPCQAVHPLTSESLPIFIANFVLMEYGTGAVMSVPAHDQRDWEFANKYQLSIQPVIAPLSGEPWDFQQAAFTEHGILENSDSYSGLSSAEAIEAITQQLVDKKRGLAKTTYRLRDWGVSRQRYWGTPIPIIHCQHCGAVPVPEEDLPVILPEDVEMADNSSTILKNRADFINTTCPQCQEPATRETDTFDTFFESSWYYARYSCVNQSKSMLDDRARYWTPVDHYIGGIEHAVMHLLYARFFHKLMRDEELLNSDEPFTRLLTQGMVLKDGAKMSKSKGNTVDPQQYIDQYGADTIRCFTIFASPPEQSLEWSDSGVEGAYRFLRKLYGFAADSEEIQALNNQESVKYSFQESSEEIISFRRQIHETLKQINYDYERTQFNTVVSGAMKLLNTLVEIKKLDDPHKNLLLHEGLSILLRVLSPITPHMTHFLWDSLGFADAIHRATWPKVAKQALQSETIEYVIQINGKRRANLALPADDEDDILEQKVITDPKLQVYLQQKTVTKLIVIKPRKLINIVVSDN